MPSPFLAPLLFARTPFAATPTALALFAAPPATHLRLRPFDLALVAIYLIGITLFGLRFRKRGKGAAADKSLKSYFLADNTIPWWAIALSIVSAETSTLTIISIPGVAFTGDFGFLQVVIGYMLGRIVVAGLFLPRYFAGEMLTAYQLIDRRFGPFLHKVTAGLFLLTRAAAEGVRVFAVSIVVAIAIGTGNVLSIAIISALTLLYTFEGGMAAVIWTDVVQMAIYMGGTVVAIATLGSHIPGGWSTIHTAAAAAGKFHMLDFTLNLTTAYTFWAGVLGGTFLTMASHGTDQLMVQRMLAARNLRQSQLALLSSGVVIFVQFALFLLIGAGLFVFYGAANHIPHIPGAPFIAQSHRAMSGVAHLPPGLSPDRIFPTFIVREMPLGLAGLLVAAILAAAMSNLSAALNSLSSATVVDFYMHFRPSADASERALISKSSTILWALVLFAIAIYSIRAGGHGHVVEIGLSIASVAYGCLLGVFLLGTLTRFATETGAALGMVCGFALNLWLWQGSFPVHLGPFTIPHVAWTWYVLIGAAATFLIGSLASLIFGRQSTRRRAAKAATTAALLFFAVILTGAPRFCGAQSKDPRISPAAPQTPGAPSSRLVLSGAKVGSTTPDFTPVSTLITTAIAQHKLPGAVVLIGHNGRIVFEHAYGDRKLTGEPGLNGQPSPAEPMTEDTIFDMASLTKVLATAPAIMQLYEQSKIASLDDPIAKYLPAFCTASEGQGAAAPEGQRPDSYQPGATPQVSTAQKTQSAVGAAHSSPCTDPERAKVTLRMLLTHTSGEPPDVDLKDPWGLAHPDKAEGIHRALTTPLMSAPGTVFRYSDINFILLGYLVEQLSGRPEDVYAREHIFLPLGMTDTRFFSLAKACGPHQTYGSSIALAPMPRGRTAYACSSADWSTSLLTNIAPTAHDNEGTAATNPDFDHLLRGTVDDPTARRMGGVAGHAGVFSTAHDVALYAEALLDKLLRNTGPFPLKQSTLQLMTAPQQPASVQPATILTLDPSQPTPTLMPTQGTPVRGFGWDINSPFSRPRGAIFPTAAPSQPTSSTPSFGHTGYTGTSLWIDPNSDTYVILLANAIHPRGRPTISPLRGEVATTAAAALGISNAAAISTFRPWVDIGSWGKVRPLCLVTGALIAVPEPTAPIGYCGGVTSERVADMVRVCLLPLGVTQTFFNTEVGPCTAAKGSPGAPFMARPYRDMGGVQASVQAHPTTRTGIDVLESTYFAALTEAAARHDHHLTLGLLTNQTGLDSSGRRTVDILHSLTIDNIQLTTLFSPEHGLFGAQDTTHLTAETDPTTGLHVTSLYGPTAADKRPTHDELASLDAVVIDLQDAGVRFYTYETVVGYFLEAAARERTEFHHDLEIILLDRPNPLGGLQVQGPISDPGPADPAHASYINYMPLPLRHGFTLGELARYIVGVKHLDVQLTVIPMQHWLRSEYFDQTGLPWINPSPNLRSLTAATFYPGLGLLDFTNISVGRGSSTPFELFGAGTSNPKPGAPSSPTASSSAKVGSAAESQWFNAAKVAAALNARHIPGVSFAPTTISIAEDANHYPYHGQTIPAVHLILPNTAQARLALNSPELGLEIIAVLHRLYPTQFQLEKTAPLLANRATFDALQRGEDPRDIARSWNPGLVQFLAARQPFLLYR